MDLHTVYLWTYILYIYGLTYCIFMYLHTVYFSVSMFLKSIVNLRVASDRSQHVAEGNKQNLVVFRQILV